MDLFGPLPKTKAGNIFILVLLGHFSRWAELIALKKAEVADVVIALRDVGGCLDMEYLQFSCRIMDPNLLQV